MITWTSVHTDIWTAANGHGFILSWKVKVTLGLLVVHHCENCNQRVCANAGILHCFTETSFIFPSFLFDDGVPVIREAALITIWPSFCQSTQWVSEWDVTCDALILLSSFTATACKLLLLLPTSLRVRVESWWFSRHCIRMQRTEQSVTDQSTTCHFIVLLPICHHCRRSAQTNPAFSFQTLW